MRPFKAALSARAVPYGLFSFIKTTNTLRKARIPTCGVLLLFARLLLLDDFNEDRV